MNVDSVEFCFFERVDPHKAILIKLNSNINQYEVLTFFREYHYLNAENRKPNIYLSDLQKCKQETVSLKGITLEEFLETLQKMNFRESSKERYDIMSELAR